MPEILNNSPDVKIQHSANFTDINDPNFQHGNDADFIHTENIVLIDQKQRIRGFYDGTSVTQIQQAIKDIKLLKKAYN